MRKYLICYILISLMLSLSAFAATKVLGPANLIQVIPGSEPATTNAGAIYYDTTLNVLKTYNGAEWLPIAQINYKSSYTAAGLISYPLAANTLGDLTSLSLEAGEWIILGQQILYNNGAVTGGNTVIGLNDASGTSTTGLIYGLNEMRTYHDGTAARSTSLFVSHRVLLGSTTTYYLKGYYQSAVTNLQIGYKIEAVRIK